MKRIVIGLMLVVLIAASITNVRVFGEQDQEPPVIVIESPIVENGATLYVNTSVLVKGKITDNIGVTAAYIGLYGHYVGISYDSTLYVKRLDLPADGTFSEEIMFMKNLGTFEGKIIITAFDGAGNKTEKTISIEYLPDFEPPVITIYSPVDGSTVNIPTVIVKGKVTDNCGVASFWIDTTKIDFAPDGSFSQKIELIEGTNTIKVVAYDAVGNKSEKDLIVTYNKIFTITASADSGGSISPSGDISVNSGNSQTFTITPNLGYHIKDVLVDGKSVGSVTTYTFENVTSNHTIEVSFEKQITQTIIILQIGKINFTVNGEIKYLDSPPIIKNSRTLVPIRVIVEALGGNVAWNAIERKVTVSLGSNTIELWIGKSIAKVNGVDTPIDSTNPKVVPEIINSRTMLPLRFVTENLGCDVQWNGATQTITITYPNG